MHVNAAIALARDRAGDIVANPKRAITFAATFVQGAERIGSFTALTDGEHQGVARHRGVAMSKFARVFDFGGDVGELLDQVFADHPSMKRCPAASQHNAADIAQLGRRHVQSAKFGGAFFKIESSAHRIAHRVRLLKDFFEHVVRVVAFLDVFGGELNFADLMIAGFADQRTDLEFVALDRNDIEVI